MGLEKGGPSNLAGRFLNWYHHDSGNTNFVRSWAVFIVGFIAAAIIFRLHSGG